MGKQQLASGRFHGTAAVVSTNFICLVSPARAESLLLRPTSAKSAADRVIQYCAPPSLHAALSCGLGWARACAFVAPRSRAPALGEELVLFRQGANQPGPWRTSD